MAARSSMDVVLSFAFQSCTKKEMISQSELALHLTVERERDTWLLLLKGNETATLSTRKVKKVSNNFLLPSPNMS